MSLWGWVAALIGGLTVIGGAFYAGMRSGRRKEAAAQLEATLETVGKIDDIKSKVDAWVDKALADPDYRRRLDELQDKAEGR